MIQAGSPLERPREHQPQLLPVPSPHPAKEPDKDKRRLKRLWGGTDSPLSKTHFPRLRQALCPPPQVKQPSRVLSVFIPSDSPKRRRLPSPLYSRRSRVQQDNFLIPNCTANEGESSTQAPSLALPGDGVPLTQRRVSHSHHRNTEGDTSFGRHLYLGLPGSEVSPLPSGYLMRCAKN